MTNFVDHNLLSFPVSNLREGEDKEQEKRGGRTIKNKCSGNLYIYRQTS